MRAANILTRLHTSQTYTHTYMYVCAFQHTHKQTHILTNLLGLSLVGERSDLVLGLDCERLGRREGAGFLGRGIRDSREI